MKLDVFYTILISFKKCYRLTNAYKKDRWPLEGEKELEGNLEKPKK